MNKKNIDRYVVSPAAAAVVGGAGSLLFVPNEGSIKMLGMYASPMVALAVSIGVGTALANLAEQPIKDAIPDYGENVNKLVLPAICGVGTVGAVYWLIDDVTGEGAVKLFMLGFAANMIGDLVGDTVKTAMS